MSEGTYGIPVVTHCCLEPHGVVIQWKAGDKADGSADEITAWPTVQYVSGYANSLAPNVKVPAANIQVQHGLHRRRVRQQVRAGRMGGDGRQPVQEGGRAPVKLFLDRATEQLIAGNRPSAFAKIKIGGKKDGTITAWQSQSWGTGGFATGGGTAAALRHRQDPQPAPQPHGDFGQCRAAARLARAQQPAGFVPDLHAPWRTSPPRRVWIRWTCSTRTSSYAPEGRVETYRYQLQKAAELAEWKRLWHPRGQAAGPVKRGLGIGL